MGIFNKKSNNNSNNVGSPQKNIFENFVKTVENATGAKRENIEIKNV